MTTDVTARLDRLERQNTRLRRGLVLTGTILVAAVCMGMQPGGNNVLPQAMHLSDPVVFNNSLDPSHQMAIIGHYQNESGLRVFDEDNNARLFIGEDAMQNPVIQFWGRQNGQGELKQLMEIGVHTNGHGYIWMDRPANEALVADLVKGAGSASGNASQFYRP
jgi:hypothetical protein